VRIELVRESSVDASLDVVIRQLQQRSFPGTAQFRDSRHYIHQPRPGDERVLAWDGQALVGGVMIYWANASAGGWQGRLACVGNVCSDPDRRGQGIASACMERTMQAARDAEAAGALLFCQAKLEPFYTRFGFVRIHNPIFLHRPDGAQFERDNHDTRMAAVVRGAAWPNGAITLDIDDF